MSKGDHDENDVDENDDVDAVTTPPRRRKRDIVRKAYRKVKSKLKRSMRIVAPIIIAYSSLTVVPKRADAGAPVMAIPKTKAQDPIQNAIEIHERKLMVEAREELSAFQAEAKEIEREKGPAARDQFEREYKVQQEQKAKAWQEGLGQLKRDLLDQGIDPDIDIEGRRQVIEYEKGVDLGTVGGTMFYVEKQYEAKTPEKSFAYKKQYNREMIKYMVQDLKNRGIDPLDYFSKHHQKTQSILDLPAAKAEALAAQYKKNLDLYGQISEPKEGEQSVKEMMPLKGTDKTDEKRLKAEAKEKAAAEKAEAKAKAKEEKERIQQEKRAAKEAAKQEKEAAKMAAATAAAALTTPATSSMDDTTTSYSDSDAGEAGAFAADFDNEDDGDGTDSTGTAIAQTESKSSVSKESKTGGIKIVPASGVVIAIGGGAYALKTMKDRSEAAEAERQRQFKLLMGERSLIETDAEKGKSGKDTMSDLMFEYENKTERDEAPEPGSTEPPKKKRKGLTSVFRKKKNDREIDIYALVSADAKAPEFATTLAKILTFGAPGRFPGVTALPGDMPLAEFDLETASAILVLAQESAGLTREESAEIFANVVNCMLIDIVDLASTSLKEKDDKATVNALGIVIDFMDLAASLYTSIADGVVITPVTYGGDIGKGKLEQMYATYAVSAMTDVANADDNLDNRLQMLRDVFQINEKKADGLMMKAWQKNLMEMMKTGEMPEGMEEMMKGMEGMDGLMPGLGDGEEPDPEQLKEMLRSLKQLKESGAIPDSELAEVKKQFKEAFGTNIEELIKQAEESGDELGQDDKELLEIMKSFID